MTDATVTNNDAAHQYEIRVDGDLAGLLEYEHRGDAIAMVHTEVLDEFQGGGHASTLVRAAVEDAVDSGLRIIPECPYVKRWLDRHDVPGAQVAAP